MEGTRAPSQKFQPVCRQEKFSNYNFLPFMLLSCMFNTETEALEGFSAIALQATAVAPVQSSSSLLCADI